MLILGGQAQVVNTVYDKEVTELRSGDVIGVSDLLRIPHIDYFGEIVAGKAGLECLVI